MLMGYREYARHRNVTLGAVQKAIRDGRITADENKKIDSITADIAWANNTDASRNAVSALPMAQQTIPLVPAATIPAAPKAAASTEDADSEADGLGGDDNSASEYRTHRAKREQFQALKQELEYQQMAGQLINVDDAKRIAYTAFRALRDAVMNVAPRIKDQVAATTDPHQVERLLESELAMALTTIDVSALLKEPDD